MHSVQYSLKSTGINAAGRFNLSVHKELALVTSQGQVSKSDRFQMVIRDDLLTEDILSAVSICSSADHFCLDRIVIRPICSTKWFRPKGFRPRGGGGYSTQKANTANPHSTNCQCLTSQRIPSKSNLSSENKTNL